MSTKNQREQLMHSAIGQVTVITFILIMTWMYTIPLYQSLSDSVLATNGVIEKYTKTSADGIAYAELDKVLSASKGKEELRTIIQSAPQKTEIEIKKVGGDPYLTWLDNAIKESTLDQEKLILKKARLNSILPTLNPLSNNITEDTVSMRKYITFIEENILKQFDIDSNAALGIQNIKYGKKGTDIPETLGSFDTEIAFTANNSSITKMIDYINKLGHPEVLSETGSISSSTTTSAVMSNPLAMIDALSLQTSLDPTKPNDINSGRMTLRFYVRGSSSTDIEYLTESVKKRKEVLKKQIDTSLESCSTDITCNKKKSLEIFARKYSEFTRATGQNTIKQGTEMIYSLSAELDSVYSLEKELKNITGK